MRHFDQKKKFIKSVAAESIDILLKQAEDNYEKHPRRAKRYVKMLWEVVKKYKVRLTEGQKTKFCRKCHTLWVPDKTVKVGLRNRINAFELICKECGYKRIIKAMGNKQ